MQQNTILWQTPNKKMAPENRREIDSDELVTCFLASGVQEYSVEAFDFKVLWIFDKTEIEELHNKYLSGTPIVVNYHDVVKARMKWIVSLRTARSILKNG
jgi:hypothetical protein